MSKKFRSVALWPDCVRTGRIPNESTDEHFTRSSAEAVCRKLRECGLGGDGEVFPLETWVEEIEQDSDQPEGSSNADGPN